MARSTISMARSTPAQNPRGLASSTSIPLFYEMLLHRLDQRRGRHRLGEVFDGAELRPALALRVVDGEKDDRDAVKGFLRVHDLEHVKAAHARHVQVAHHEIRLDLQR